MYRSTVSRLSHHAAHHAPPVLFSSQPGKAAQLITMNREKALNSLNLEMIELMLPKYREFAAGSKNSSFVVLKGAGTKAFCAGGDIVSIYKDKPHGTQKEFFYREYQLNHAIMTFPHPHVALWDGIVMGGGVGVSAHGSHRVATEKAMFAMPETGIGLFPDVGGSWFLPRLPHEGLGKYLALTGHRLKGSDLVHAGIATHFVSREVMPSLEAALCELADASLVDETISQRMPSELPPFSLDHHLEQIKKYFGKEATTVEHIVHDLKSATGADHKWASNAAEILSKMSPSSMKISLELNIRGGKLTDPVEMFKLEYNTTQRCMKTKDFFSGVNALLIEKHGKPVWNPATLEEVSVEDVEKHFQPDPDHGVVWHPTEPFPKAKL